MSVYATPADYRARRNVGETIADALLVAELEASSRLIDKELRWRAREFAPDFAPDADDAADTTRTFIAAAGGTLWLRDEAGAASALRSVTSVSGRDAGDYRLAPLGADTPARAIKLLAGVKDWEAGELVDVTGRWGWPAVPPVIRELTIHVAIDMRDSHRGGAAGRVAVLDDVVEVQPDTWRLWRSARMLYSADSLSGLS